MTSSGTPSNIVIVGQGAIGSLLAAKAHQQQIPYSVITRKPPQLMHYQHLDNGLELSFTPPACAELSATDILILPLKAFDIQNALLQQIIPQQTAIVLMHNGMGTIEETCKHFPNNPILAATTSYGAYKSDYQHIIETGQGKTDIGWVQHPSDVTQQQLDGLLAPGLGPVSWQQNIQHALWLKLAVNAVINPLTALHQIANGELASTDFAETISQLCQELAQVMAALGMPTSAEELESNARTVIANTANNYSSMNRDIAAHRRSEIDYINGYVVKQAQQLGVSVPLTHQLWQQIKQLES